MKKTHTPGIWKWEYDDDTKSGIRILADDTQIIDFVGGNNIFEAEANAKLIEAAPLLLKALQNLLQSYAADFKTITGGELNDTEAVKQAKSAIQKATL